jgi:hypothetical protein
MKARRHVRAFAATAVLAAAALLGSAAIAVAAGGDDPRGAPKFRDVPFTDTTDASAATASPDDPSTSCASDPPTASVWYRFQPKADGVFTIDTLGSDYDTVLAVFTEAPGQSARNLTQITCNDDWFGLQSLVQFEGNRNTTYLILVDTWSDSGAGTLVLNAS